MMEENWFGLYARGWGDTLVEGSMAHPAKVRPALALKIYEHAIEEGWLEEGSTVIDPFAGIGGFAFHALQKGLNWIGFELEERFCVLLNRNVEYWQRKYAPAFPRWGEAHVYQGDSRYLSLLLSLRANGAVSSPPYVGSLGTGSSGIDWSKQADRQTGHPHGWNGEIYGQQVGQLGAMSEGNVGAVITSPPFGAGDTRDRYPAQEGEIASNLTRAYTMDRQGADAGNLARMDAVVSSPPYCDGGTHQKSPEIDAKELEDWRTDKSGGRMGISQATGYGDTEGQLAAMPAGCVSSPPFAGSTGSDDPDKRGGLFRDPKRRDDVNLTGEYGDTEGQLGKMAAAISSPPYERSLDRGTVDSAARVKLARSKGVSNAEHISPIDMERIGERTQEYGDSEGQLGVERADTFWSAARTIVAQVYDCLAPGAHAIWVVKAYVRDKKVVDFPGQWQALCESVGFRTEHIHKAWMTEGYGVQLDMFGGEVEQGKAHKSFFRRLYESKYPENRIDYEIVLCMSK